MKASIHLLALLLLSIVLPTQSAGDIAFVEVLPRKVTLRPGQQFRFHAQCYDSQELSIILAVRWQATGGMISDSGLYTAGNREGVYQIVAVDPISGSAGTARIIIRTTKGYYHQGACALKLAPAMVTMAAGSSCLFRLQAVDRLEKPVQLPPVFWDVSGGTIAPACHRNPRSSAFVFRAGLQPGVYKIEAVSISGSKAIAKVVIKSSAATTQFSQSGFSKDGGRSPALLSSEIIARSANPYFRIRHWQVTPQNELVGEFSIIARTIDPGLTLIEAFVFNSDGRKYVVAHKRIKRCGQTAYFRSKYHRQITEYIGIVAYNRLLEPVFTFQYPCEDYYPDNS